MRQEFNGSSEKEVIVTVIEAVFAGATKIVFPVSVKTL